MAFTDFTAVNQLGTIYVGYFGRAADPAGLNYWLNTDYQGLYDKNIADGQTPETASINACITIATSFSNDTEAKGIYSFLADPATGDANAFVDAVYMNLFGHAADEAGKAYWVGELEANLADQLYVGKFILQVMNGAGTIPADNPLYQQGQDDLSTMTNRAEVAAYYALQFSARAGKWDVLDDHSDAQSLLKNVTKDPATVVSAKTAVDDAITLDLVQVVKSADVGVGISVDSAVTIDAVGSFKFTDDATVENNVIITNFTSDDVIEVSNAVGSYQITNNGADVMITYSFPTHDAAGNDIGLPNTITLSGVVTADDVIYDQETFESAIGFDAFTFA